MAYITGRAQHPLWRVFKVIMFLALIAGVAGTYFYLHPELWRKWTKGTPLAPPPVITSVYKWQDRDGEWQITDQPPPPGIKYEVQIYNSDVNVVPSLSAEEQKK